MQMIRGPKPTQHAELRDQETLLRETDWNVLIILDACRGDYFRRVVPDAEVVRAMRGDTPDWLRAMYGLNLWPDRLVYISGNPHSPKEQAALGDMAPPMALRYIGGRFVHPQNLNAEMFRWLDAHGQPRHLAIHYMQPHAPYRGISGGPMPEAVREAYLRNIRFVMPHVQSALARLKGHVILTSDHGEILGEYRRRDGTLIYGHNGLWKDYPELWQVPWVEYDLGDFEPHPIPESELVGGAADEGAIREHLVALGYL